jgi:chromosome segregation ATPase
MANRGSGEAESLVPFAPKLNVRSEAGDPLDEAGQTILGWLQQAADTAEANKQQALEVAHKLSAQLRAAEDRIRELEASVSRHQDRADRAERWLYQISVEIEERFFGRVEDRRSQRPSPQAVLRNPKQ